MFLIKKFISSLLLPLPLCLIILLVGCLLLMTRKRYKLGRLIVVGGFILLTAFGYATIPAESFIRGLEDKFPPVISYDADSGIHWVVVLGGGYVQAPALPPTDQISFASLARLSEGIRIHNQLPNSKIIISSGRRAGASTSGSRLMANIALEFGLNEKDLVLESESRDTRAQALNIQKIVNNERFILVTSALHMPRAMALFENEGMHPVPAPVSFIVKGPRKLTLNSLIPTAAGLGKSELVIHEYLGLAWAKIRGFI